MAQELESRRKGFIVRIKEEDSFKDYGPYPDKLAAVVETIPIFLRFYRKRGFFPDSFVYLEGQSPEEKEKLLEK